MLGNFTAPTTVIPQTEPVEQPESDTLDFTIPEGLPFQADDCVTVDVLAGDGSTVAIPLEKWQEWNGAARKTPTPIPPPGVLLYLSDEDGRPCAADTCFMWTWSGDKTGWHYTREHPLPPHTLTIGPLFKGNCPKCVRKELRVVEQVFSNGTKHLRAECAVCGGFVSHLKRPPVNLDLEYRAT